MRQNIYMGVGPQALQPTLVGGGASVAYPVELYQTPVLDLTKTLFGMELVPARPGHFPFQVFRWWLITQKNGTQTSPIAYRSGSNEANAIQPTPHNNFVSAGASPSNADVNNVNLVIPCWAAGSSGAGNAQRLTNKPIIMDITAAAVGTGNFSLFASLATFVAWSPTGGSDGIT